MGCLDKIRQYKQVRRRRARLYHHHHLVTQVIAFANPFAAFPTGLTQVGFFFVAGLAQSPKGNKGMRTVN